MNFINKIQTKKIGILGLIVCVSCILYGVCMSAMAQDKLLKVTEQKIYVGDVFDLAICLQEEAKDGVTFSLKDENQSGSIRQKTLFSASEAGTYVVLATKTEEEKELSEELTVEVLPAETLELTYGEMITLPVAEYIWQQEYVLEADTGSVEIGSQGQIRIVGFQETKIMATNSLGDTFELASICVKSPKLSLDTFVIAKGITKEGITVENFIALGGETEQLAWSTQNTSVAVWTEKGICAVAKGETNLVLKMTAYSGETIQLSAKIIVTDPSLTKKTYVIAAGCMTTPRIEGTVAQSTWQYDSQQAGAAYFLSDGKIYGNFKGTQKLTVTVDGKSMTITVKVSNPYYNHFSVVLYKGMTKNLKMKGLVSGSKVTYSSSKKKVVTISSKGKMRAKKNGHAVITVKADGKKMKLWVEISSKRGYKASKKAIAISKTKTTYSQPRRMSKGYYDCSSLVSRVYRKYGVYFGSKRGWSPVAADIGKWCVRNHKAIAKKSVSYKKLLPGDLIFFSGWKNGRYRNITHIEIYTGEAMDVSASSRYGKVVHYGYGKGDSVVLIARPTK